MTRLDNARLTLIGRLRHQLRLRNYSRRTEEAYVSWVKRYVRFHNLRNPVQLGEAELRAFLTDLAVTRSVSASTQNQARSAVVFLYRDVLRIGIAWIGGIERAKRPARLPVVMTSGEAHRVLACLTGAPRLMCLLMYGAGLRVSEVLELRVKDVDVDGGSIMVRDGKGQKDRLTMLPKRVIEALGDHLGRVERLWKKDQNLPGFVNDLPGAYGTKNPGALRDFRWAWIFPARRTYVDDKSGRVGRWHQHPTTLQRAVARAVKASAITKRATCHTFRHSFATQLLEMNYDMHTIQELMGHADVSTTMIYTHVLNRGGRGVQSPLDRDG